MASNPVVHFEMPYEESERVRNFYEQAFGWEMEAMPGEDMGGYITAETAETHEGRPTMPGTINGGFFVKKPDWPGQYPSVVIAVEDLPAAMAKVREAGGEVLGEPVEIAGVGSYVSFQDTEGNRVSLLQPAPRS